MREGGSGSAGDAQPSTVGDEGAFATLTERHRRELHVHCYRMRAYWPSAEAAAAQPEVARQMRALPKVVCSTTLQDPGWENVTVARDGVAAVRTLKQEDGKDVAIFGSSTLTGGLLAAGLVDELRLIVSPVLLGAGRTLLDGLTDPAHPVAMTLLRTTTFASGNMLACYRPATAPAG